MNLVKFYIIWCINLVAMGRLYPYAMIWGPTVENGKKRPPLTSDPPNPEIITVMPQRKFHGLNI